MMKSIFIKGVKISVCEMSSAISEAMSLLSSGRPSYICVTDAGNVVNAYRNSSELRNAINNSDLSLPDGRPISILAGMKGVEGIGRVAGPDFMQKIFEQTSGTNISHFFLGDTNEILDKLINELSTKYNIKISGFYSPPFENWSPATDDDIIKRLRIVNADFIWVSLGGGKQEVWMMKNHELLEKGVMIGVGAAFRFLTGDIQRAPIMMQKTGLEWLYRLIQQPGKMFGRYAGTLPYFAAYSIQELFNNKMTPK
ncbi:MAG: WecB/TagA/CpsF family glycosyltransferase [Ignavibacteria bacterium]|nr:WecB/TagA/CpsF family glycosyltransferase [Ignavibacteria bacterium]